MILLDLCSKTTEAFITTWCFKVPNIMLLYLIFKDCPHLLITTVILLEVATNALCEFAVIFSINPEHEALMLFCKAATDKNILENLVSILGGVVWDGMLHDPRKDPREWHKQ